MVSFIDNYIYLFGGIKIRTLFINKYYKKLFIDLIFLIHFLIQLFLFLKLDSLFLNYYYF